MSSQLQRLKRHATRSSSLSYLAQQDAFDLLNPYHSLSVTHHNDLSPMTWDYRALLTFIWKLFTLKTCSHYTHLELLFSSSQSLWSIDLTQQSRKYFSLEPSIEWTESPRCLGWKKLPCASILLSRDPLILERQIASSSQSWKDSRIEGAWKRPLAFNFGFQLLNHLYHF